MQKCITLIPLLFSAHALFAQNATKDSSSTDVWNFSVSQYYYFIPYSNNSLMLTACADHKSLHLETRYNYEDQNTISVFAGWSLAGGKKIQFNIKPMCGVVAGNTKGIAPAIETEISYKFFDFYSESEVMLNVYNRNGGKEKENNFFYTWRELAITPIKCLRTGITGQRTHLLNSKLSVQRGVFAEYSFWKLSTSLYYFKHSSNNNFVIAGLSVHF